MSIVRFENVSRIYTSGDHELRALDHVSFTLDEGKFALKYNGPHMVLGAFYTMADVIDDPEKFTNRFRSETGSDYAGKSSCVDKTC